MERLKEQHSYGCICKSCTANRRLSEKEDGTIQRGIAEKSYKLTPKAEEVLTSLKKEIKGKGIYS